MFVAILFFCLLRSFGARARFLSFACCSRLLALTLVRALAYYAQVKLEQAPHFLTAGIRHEVVELQPKCEKTVSFVVLPLAVGDWPLPKLSVESKYGGTTLHFLTAADQRRMYCSP